MTNSKALFQELISAITLNESSEEIDSIVYLFLEKQLGISKTDIIAERIVKIDSSKKNLIENFIQQVNNHKPIQYILGECEFYGRTFFVSEHVLIPRPETEELVREVIHYCKQQKRPLRIVDIGTGSGCIPITLALENKDTEVYAIDVSESALIVAKLNAQSLNASVQFYLHDILKEDLMVKKVDVVVSNPPYITNLEKDKMKKNVLQFEPHLALFVPDDDPLLFYKTIAAKSKKVLNDGGLIAVEINEQFGDNVATLFSDTGFTSVEIIKDIFGKERIVKGLKA